MTQTDVLRPVQPGERAPRFSLPAVHREGVVSLDDYLDRSPLLLAVFRGLYCPFCRRAIAELGGIAERLKAAGVETLAVVATNADHARLYFKHRPARVALAADAERGTHRAYGVPSMPMTPQLLEAIQTTPVNPTGDLPRPMPLPEAAAELDRRQGFQPSEIDRLDQERQFGQVQAQFLVDRTGVVRWVNVEGATEGLAGFGKFPTADELLRAARSVL
jgi:peroxiredoxin